MGKSLMENAAKKGLMWNICPHMGGWDKHFGSDTDKLKVFRKMISKGTRNLVPAECLVQGEITVMTVV